MLHSGKVTHRVGARQVVKAKAAQPPVKKPKLVMGKKGRKKRKP